MSDPTSRPALLNDAAVAIAYQRWLVANGFEDSDVSAWRFAAEAGGAVRMSDSPLAKEPPNRSRSRRLAPAIAAFAAVLLVSTVTAYALSSAERWTKVDAVEQGHTIQAANGQWTVDQDVDDLICYTGQNWGSCIDDMTDQYDVACVGRVVGLRSKVICDSHLRVIQEMKTEDVSGTIGAPGAGPRLKRSLLTEPEWVVDVPEQKHVAICYLGFLGECP